MQQRLFARPLAIAVATATLAGCATPTTVDLDALPATPTAFRQARVEADIPSEAAWWHVFTDPGLDELVTRALARNDRIQIAVARLVQARALVSAAESLRQPQVGAGVTATRGTSATPPSPRTGLAATVNASWDADLIGKLSLGAQASAQEARAREAQLEQVRLIVAADIAQGYFALRALEAEEEIVANSVAAYASTLKLTEARHAAGDVAELDVTRLRTEVAAARSELLALQQQRAVRENALAVLAGEVATEFVVPRGRWGNPPPSIPAGTPSRLVERRPDVAASLALLKAAQARAGVAQAAWLPDVQLSASGGVASANWSQLIQASAKSWGFGALLSLPLLDGGRRQANIDIARAEIDAAFSSHREQLLVAFKEVESELAALQLLAEQAKTEAAAVDAATRSTALSEVRYQNGLVSQLELLDAQRSELRSRRSQVRVKAAQFQETVALIRALGGSW